MSLTQAFSNVIWPSDVIYNVVASDGSRIEGGADIEHHFVKEGVNNVWIEKNNERCQQILGDYAIEASNRISES